MGEQLAPGLTADWLNAWLAAIGVTVVASDVRLAWTDDPVPRARFSYPDGDDLAELVASGLPPADDLDGLAIAGLPQNVPPDRYRQAAVVARANDDLSLGVLTTDIGGDGKNGALPTGPFNVGAPRGETLFTRLRACRRKLDDASLPHHIRATFDGRGTRHDMNGLGFDYRRIAASVPGEATKMVDPVVECLAFFGLLLHPLGASGRRPRQRGWTPQTTRRHAFRWPAWREPLDRWAIDTLLDGVYSGNGRPAVSTAERGALPIRIRSGWRLMGVTGLYGTVAFRQVGSSDATRGYASERLA